MVQFQSGTLNTSGNLDRVGEFNPEFINTVCA